MVYLYIGFRRVQGLGGFRVLLPLGGKFFRFCNPDYVYKVYINLFCMYFCFSMVKVYRWLSAPKFIIQVFPIGSQRINLSGSQHSGHSQHGQCLGYTGSSVQDLPQQCTRQTLKTTLFNQGLCFADNNKSSVCSLMHHCVRLHVIQQRFRLRGVQS